MEHEDVERLYEERHAVRTLGFLDDRGSVAFKLTEVHPDAKDEPCASSNFASLHDPVVCAAFVRSLVRYMRRWFVTCDGDD